jgi:hypothetical protein
MRTRGVLIVVAAVATSLAVHSVITRVRAQGVPEYEFTVEERVGPTGGDHKVTKTYFRRADGTSGYIIRDTLKLNGRTATTAFYQSPKESAEIAVQVEGGLRTTYPVPPEVAQAWALDHVEADCTRKYDGAQKTGEVQLAGITAQQLRLADAVQEADYYVAPSLGCATLKEHHRWKSDTGAFVSWTDVELLNLKVGPPSSEYFDLYVGAREVPPSEGRLQIHALLHPGEPVPECYVKGNAKHDAVYNSARDEAVKGWPSLEEATKSK